MNPNTTVTWALRFFKAGAVVALAAGGLMFLVAGYGFVQAVLF